jgi:exosortase K
MTSIKIKQNAIFYLAAILMALALKQYYSQARAEDLGWILKPTAGLVSLITGDEFSFKTGTGYVCGTQRIIIAPGCAGINFMLMAFGMSVFTGMHHMQRSCHRFLWLVCSLAAAYGLTMGVNTLRIIASIHTFHADFSSSGLAWGRVHRLEGVVIYFFFQYLFYSMIRRIIQKMDGPRIEISDQPLGLDHPERSFQSITHRDRPKWGVSEVARKTFFTGLTPIIWYLAVTLAVPFLNSAPKKTGDLFYDHATMVFSLCLITWICIVAVILCARGLRLLLKRRLPET